MNSEVYMRFEARDLAEFDSPMAATSLVVGATYFIANFVDENLLIPCLQPIVCIGKGLPPEGLPPARLRPAKKRKYLFQDAPSYLSGLRISDDLSGDIKLHVFVKSGLRNIHEFDAALDLLLRCSVRRSKHRPADSLA